MATSKIKEGNKTERTASDKQENSQSHLGGMLRKKVIAYTLASAIAATGAWFAHKQISPQTVAKPEYSLEIVFLNHGSDQDAIRFLEEIDEAKRAGKPFKFVFIENAGQKESEYKTNVLAANRQLSELRQYYLSLTNMGLSTEEAEESCRERISPHGINVSGHNFIPIVLAGCAIRDLKIMPIESYQIKEADMISTNNNTEILHTELIGLLQKNATLGEIASFEKKYWEETSKEVKFRNDTITRGLDGKFKEARELFPELKTSLGNGETLSAIGFIGEMHAPLYYELSQTDQHVSFKEKIYFSGSKDTLMGRIVASMDKIRPLTEREAYLAAIDDRVISPLSNEIGKTNTKLISELRDGAFNLNLNELEELNIESSKILNVRERCIFIANKILGRDQLR